MVDDFGSALRRLRYAVGLSQPALAARLHYSTAMISRIEAGDRRASPEFAAEVDAELGTTPLMSTLLGVEEEDDDMRRRALLTVFGTAVGLTAATGHPALAEVVRRGLHDADGQPDDWDTIVEGFERRRLLAPSPEFADALLVQLLVARQAVAETRDPAALRAASLLGLMYGLWLGDEGGVTAAQGWYRTATALADRSGDQHARTYVRARVATRGTYEGASPRAVAAGINEALALSPAPSVGTLEAHAAAAQLAALTGDVAAGRQAVADMWRAAERLPAPDGPGPAQRAASFQVYVEGRAGDLPNAQHAYDSAAPYLRQVPVWDAEARVYVGRAMVRAGDLGGGVRYALDAIRPIPAVPRVVRMGVSDLVAAVPAGFDSDELAELRTFAAPDPGPWEMIPG